MTFISLLQFSVLLGNLGSLIHTTQPNTVASQEHQRHQPMGQHNLPHCRYSTRVALRTWQIFKASKSQSNNHLTYQNKYKPWRHHLKESAANTRHHRTTPEVTARSPLRGASSQIFHIWSDTELVRWVLGGPSPWNCDDCRESLCCLVKDECKASTFFYEENWKWAFVLCSDPSQKNVVILCVFSA